ncbi:hypothetical protein TWF569_006434 [Orbilia oligospora]|nr:hypothetical protein TWF706_010205 [Orbilia oligospora]KAF3146426.1 hypothetical protein TWF569_006434 [Orbilia oligospora]
MPPSCATSFKQSRIMRSRPSPGKIRYIALQIRVTKIRRTKPLTLSLEIMSSRVANCICSTREQGTKRSTLKIPLFLSLQRKSEKACVGNGTEQGLVKPKVRIRKIGTEKESRKKRSSKEEVETEDSGERIYRAKE